MTNRSGPFFLRHRYGPNILQDERLEKSPHSIIWGYGAPQHSQHHRRIGMRAWGQAEWRPKLFHRPPMGI
jgi:hypothetical protein